MTFRRKLLLTLALGIAPIAGFTPAVDASGPPAGTCGASQGCGCGGVYVLKYKFILAHC